MNIFVVNENPFQAARELCNQHVIKMILESCQILSTAMYLKGVSSPYKPTHIKHPCIKWAAESVHNFQWVFCHCSELSKEYNKRYNKNHKCKYILDEIESLWYKVWDENGLWQLHTPFVQCMPDKYKNANAIEAYKTYYIKEKSFAKWKPRAEPPNWWREV